jgi:hypothetical protein
MGVQPASDAGSPVATERPPRDKTVAIVYAMVLTGIFLILFSRIVADVMIRQDALGPGLSDAGMANFALTVGVIGIIGESLLAIGLLHGFVMGRKFPDIVRAGMAVALGFVAMYIVSGNDVLSLLRLF